MPVVVNGEAHPWREGLTVEGLLAEKKYTYPLKIVILNGARVPRPEWPTRTVEDGDKVDVIHMMTGG